MTILKTAILRTFYYVPLLLLLCSSLYVAGDPGLPPDPSPQIQQYYNITKISNVTETTGELAWGAGNLPFGSGAGAGINWKPGFIGGGFNAGSEKPGTPALGGGWSINETYLVWGFGLKWDDITLNVAIDGTKGGNFQVKINGKVVEIPASS